MATDKKEATLKSAELAVVAAEAASEKKGSDIVALNVAEMLVVTDYFVVITGMNDRQVRTIAEEVERKMKEAGSAVVGREGEGDARWLLLDFGDVVVHVFQPDERDFYRLERLWSEAPRLDLPEEVTNPSQAPGEGRTE